MAISLLGAALISSLISGTLGFAGQQIAAAQDRAHSSALQEDAQRHQEQLRETQYQTAVKDIENAGLNPAMLYGSGGAGISSTPSSAISGSGSHNSQNMFSVAQAGEFLNAITNARALDYKMQGRESYTSKQIYDKSGQLITEIIKDYKSN